MRTRKLKAGRTWSLRPSPSLAVAFIALFVAIGGVGYSAVKLKANAVKTKNIKNGAVTTPKLAADVKAPRAGTADNALTAGTADNALKLGGTTASDLQAASASTEEPADHALDPTFTDITSVQITTTGTKRVIATASVSGASSGADFLQCRLKIDANVGLLYSQVMNTSGSGFGSVTGSLSPLASVAAIPAGTHTVTLQCEGEASSADGTETDAALAAWAVST